jgi:hypothetical protein
MACFPSPDRGSGRGDGRSDSDDFAVALGPCSYDMPVRTMGTDAHVARTDGRQEERLLVRDGDGIDR